MAKIPEAKKSVCQGQGEQGTSKIFTPLPL